MKLHLLKLQDFPNFATDGAGFLWKKSGKNYKPVRPMKHPLGSNVYFVVTIDKKNVRFEQKELEKLYLEAVKDFVEERT
jgi:hypothetical protein